MIGILTFDKNEQELSSQIVKILQSFLLSMDVKVILPMMLKVLKDEQIK